MRGHRTPSAQERAYRAQRAKTIAADKAHDEMMTRVAARGGLTLEQLRALPKSNKEAFILEHRDRDNDRT